MSFASSETSNLNDEESARSIMLFMD